MPAQNTESQEDKSQPHKMAHEAAFQPCAHQYAKAKGRNDCAPHHIMPAHKNTPRVIVCGGCLGFNRQDKLFSLRRTGQALRRYR